MIGRLGTSTRSNAGAVGRLGDGSLVSGEVPWWLLGGIEPESVGGVWQPKGAASLAASYLRIAGDEGYADIDPAVVGGVAPNWSAGSGWIGNGTAYLDTGIVPAANRAMAIRVDNRLSNNRSGYCGSYSDIGGISGISINSPWNGIVDYNNAGRYQYSPSASDNGVFFISGQYAYFNGGKLNATPMAAWSTHHVYTLLILARRFRGAVQNQGYFNAIAFVYWKTVLTDAQVLAVSTAMAAL